MDEPNPPHDSQDEPVDPLEKLQQENSAAVEAAAAKARADLEAENASLNDKLQEFDAKMAGIRKKQAQAEEQRQKDSMVAPDTGKSLGMGLTIAYTIIGMPLAGYIIGLLIDNRVGGDHWRTWLAAGGCLFGLGGAVLLLQRNSSK